MKFKNIWTITSKEFSLFRRRKYILYTLFLLPSIIAIGLPLIVGYSLSKRPDVPIANFIGLFHAFPFFFLVIAAVVPIVIASYSFVGEKTEKTLEPLLATPATDDEILLGKSLATFIPVMIMIWIGALIFTILFDVVTAARVGYNYFPNSFFDVLVFLDTPLGTIMAIEISIIISSRQNDVRSAQQMAGLTALPFLLIYILTEFSIISLDVNTFLIIGAILAVIDIGLFFVAHGLFQREEILTKWK